MVVYQLILITALQRTRQILYTHHQIFFNDHERVQWQELKNMLQSANRNTNRTIECFGRKNISAIPTNIMQLMNRTADLLKVQRQKPMRIFNCSGNDIVTSINYTNN